MENRLQFARRRADHLEHVGGGSLLLQRLGEIGGLGLHLVEQADVADSDHGLVGEGLEQSDLLITEWVHLGATEHDGSDAFAVTQQRYTQNAAGAGTGRPLPCVGEFVAFGGEEVVHVHCFPVEERSSGNPFPVDRPSLHIKRYRSVMRAGAQAVDIVQEHDGIDGVAKLAGTLDNGLEDRPDIGRRGSDNLEDIAAAGLISQRLAEIARARLYLVEQLHIADGDHGLVGKGLQQLDVMGRECAGLLAGDADQSDGNPIAQQRDEKHSAEAAQLRHCP